MTAVRRIRPDREAPELAAMMGRMLRALVRRATDGDLFALEAIQALRAQTDDAMIEAMAGAHDGPARYSWTEVGRGLGMSRQAARQAVIDRRRRDGA